MSDVAKLLTTVQRYSARAEEARTRADQMQNLAARQGMLDVAASYNSLEDMARAKAALHTRCRWSGSYRAPRGAQD
jgi:hypothetical protein